MCLVGLDLSEKWLVLEFGEQQDVRGVVGDSDGGLCGVAGNQGGDEMVVVVGNSSGGSRGR